MFKIKLTQKKNKFGDPGPGVGDPTPKGGDGTTPECCLTLVSNLLLVDVNIGLDMLGNFN